MATTLHSRNKRPVAVNGTSEHSDEVSNQERAGSCDEMESDGVSRRLVTIFKMLADETRLRILLLLFEKRELNVRALCDLLDQSQPAVSHHLALLRADGLIECRREGKNNFYHILPRRFEQLVDTVLNALPVGDRSRESASGATILGENEDLDA